jgi:hypothetical protein
MQHPGNATLCCRRTFKYLMGVLSAKWVLREGWLVSCLGEQAAADERQFLVRMQGIGWQ